MYTKKSVEVNDTDVEVNDLECTIIGDMCTLTSVQGIATGKYHGAVLTNSGQTEKWSIDNGRASGDLVFPIAVKFPNTLKYFRALENPCSIPQPGKMSWSQIIDFVGEANFNFSWKQPNLVSCSRLEAWIVNQ
ncbi:unnamed protein product [Orchesella dallaii]|uniref:Uncharacterized protein n=1 Tax=Orchesella dallaii TaxID=48710 RepID=A0ABP1Q9P1_9HEXA